MVPLTPDPLSSMLELSEKLEELRSREEGGVAQLSLAAMWIALADTFSKTVSQVGVARPLNIAYTRASRQRTTYKIFGSVPLNRALVIFCR